MGSCDARTPSLQLRPHSHTLQARATEDFFVARWTRKGTTAPPQALVPGGKEALAPFVFSSSNSSSSDSQGQSGNT
jgi:hypothetical protein